LLYKRKEMSLTMTPLIANILMQSGQDTHFWLILISLFGAAVMLVGLCWQLLDNWKKRTRGRNWPTVSAVIDIVSVAFIKDDIPSPKADLDGSYYKATLTYTYNNPGQQMGDYSRDFAKKEDAEAWAKSNKGETVTVHVDPRDPTRSVLREEDLQPFKSSSRLKGSVVMTFVAVL
jgi:Protein of unknown function (DUF3592)